jgi:hypothetical protein
MTVDTDHLLNEVKEDEEPPKPVVSNFTVLAVTTVLFGAFVVAEIIGALVR